MIPNIIFIVFTVLFAISITPVHAQHHSGALAPAIDFDGLKVALITILTPEDFTVEDTKNANLSIRFFDSDTNLNIKSVTYRVQIFQNENLLANEYFFDEDGDLELEIRPTKGCLEQDLWKCTKYYGEKHAIAGAYYARGESLPIIQGPVFDKSGQYEIKVSIVGATNPKTLTTKDFLFETFLHIPQKETFMIKTANAQEFPINIKSYDSAVSNLNYDDITQKISYEIAHNKDHSQLHDYNNKQVISLKKDFPSFKQGYDVEIFAEDVKLKPSSYEFDVSSPDENIIRVNIPHEEMLLIEKKLESKNKKDTIKMEIISGEQTNLSQLNFVFENGFNANVSWDSKLNAGKIPMTFFFFDKNNNPAQDILFAYSVTDSTGKEIWSNIGTGKTFLGILSPHGMTQESILIPENGQYQLKLILTGQNSKNFETFFTAKSDFSISQTNISTKKVTSVPSWVKNNAGWWAEGITGDNEFVQSIQFLIKEEIINIPITETRQNESQEIPSWVKNNAGWWAKGLISESDFIKGIEFLSSQGIIKVD